MSMGFLPTTGTELAQGIKLHLPFKVTISGDIEPVGKVDQSLQHLSGRCGAAAQISSGYFRGGGAEREVAIRWLVKAKPGDKATITARTPRAGTATCTLEIAE